MCETQLNCQISHLCYQYLLKLPKSTNTEEKTCIQGEHLKYSTEKAC